MAMVYLGAGFGLTVDIHGEPGRYPIGQRSPAGAFPAPDSLAGARLKVGREAVGLRAWLRHHGLTLVSRPRPSTIRRSLPLPSYSNEMCPPAGSPMALMRSVVASA